jgi:hypothetical protein
MCYESSAHRFAPFRNKSHLCFFQEKNSAQSGTKILLLGKVKREFQGDLTALQLTLYDYY